MPDTNGAPNSKTNPSPNMPERPPLLKKSKINADNTLAGQLFPAVLRVSSTSPSYSESHTTSATNDANFGFGDRDYVYPSFLGPHTTRSRVNVKSTSKSQRNQLELPARSESMPSNLSCEAKVESKMKLKPKLKAEKDLNALSIQVSTSASSALSGSSSANFSNARRPSAHRYSWILFLVGVFMLFQF